MVFSKGGRGRQAPYTSTHVRVPDPLKAEVEHTIREWKRLIDSGKMSPTEAVAALIEPGESSCLSLNDAIVKAQEILKRKKSANDSMINLLTSIYSVDLPKDILGRNKTQ